MPPQQSRPHTRLPVAYVPSTQLTGHRTLYNTIALGAMVVTPSIQQDTIMHATNA